jgi:hypothetical protein
VALPHAEQTSATARVLERDFAMVAAARCCVAVVPAPRTRYGMETSIDQSAATLASWFGGAASDIPLLFPNLSNLSTKNLAFL